MRKILRRFLVRRRTQSRRGSRLPPPSKIFSWFQTFCSGGKNIAAVADATYKRETVGAAGMCPLPLIQQGLH